MESVLQRRKCDIDNSSVNKRHARSKDSCGKQKASNRLRPRVVTWHVGILLSANWMAFPVEREDCLRRWQKIKRRVRVENVLRILLVPAPINSRRCAPPLRSDYRAWPE